MNETLTHVRIVNDAAPELITIKDALAEINNAMMGEGNKKVRRMSSVRSSATIEYRDGRKVEIRPAVMTDKPAEAAGEWNGTRSNPSHLHRFGASLRAVCSRGITSAGAGHRDGVLVGHDRLRTRTEIESDGKVYTVCPRCSSRES